MKSVRFHVYEEMETALGLDDETLRRRIGDLADAARAKWIALAGDRLRSSSRAYSGGIQAVEYPPSGNGFTATISLVGDLPNMVEHGADGFDIRTTVLKGGQHVRFSKKGHAYAFIPFGASRVGSTGRDMPVVGEAYEKADDPMSPEDAASFGKKVQEAMDRVVRAAERSARLGVTNRPGLTTTTPEGGATRWGARLPMADAGQKMRERHAVPLYAGAYKMGKGYAKAVQGTMRTFRAISMNPETYRSDAGGMNWWHPGIEARRLHVDVLEYIRRMAPMVLGG